jgi:hypothetical protein
MTRTCETCRWWDVHDIGMKKGTCRARRNDGPVHRYWRIPMPNGGFAMLDSFEPVETRPSESCGAYEVGQADGRVYVGDHHKDKSDAD